MVVCSVFHPIWAFIGSRVVARDEAERRREVFHPAYGLVRRLLPWVRVGRAVRHGRALWCTDYACHPRARTDGGIVELELIRTTGWLAVVPGLGLRF